MTARTQLSPGGWPGKRYILTVVETPDEVDGDMLNLYAAIMTRFNGSLASTSVGGRIFYKEAPEGTLLPYIVFMRISGSNSDTFDERVDETVIQFSLYSSSRGIMEIGTMYENLRALFDDATFSVPGGTLVRCQYQSATDVSDETITREGTVGVKHWPVEYVMVVKKT
jgi:hypothetical protein